MKKITLIILACTGLSQVTRSQTAGTLLREAQPSAAGFSVARIEGIDRFIQ